MATLLGLIVLLSVGGWLLVKRYERYLDSQAGPWMSSELSVQRSRPRLVRRRVDADDR